MHLCTIILPLLLAGLSLAQNGPTEDLTTTAEAPAHVNDKLTVKERVWHNRRQHRMNAREYRRKFGGHNRGISEKIDRMEKVMSRWNRRAHRRSKLDRRANETSAAIAELMENRVEGEPSIFAANEEFGDFFIEGDIVPSKHDIAQMEQRLREEEQSGDDVEHIRSKRGATFTSRPSWPKDKPIPFAIEVADYTPEEKTIIRRGIQTIQENTCLNFQENGNGLRLNYYAGAGCNSDVGDVREAANEGQWLSLSPKGGCVNVGTVQHETMHALGFMHTQSRTDRDENLSVDYSVIQKKRELNFEKLAKADSNTNYGVPYELGSKMHYKPLEFSAMAGRPVLIPKDKDYATAMGAADQLTFYDWKLINSRYNCSDSCKNKVSCRNGGYQHPRECSRCFCPVFYKGPLCDTENAQVLTLQPGKEELVTYLRNANYDKIQTANTRDFDGFEKEMKVIRAPSNRRIRVTIKNIGSWNMDDCFSTCSVYGVEIRDGDLALAGKRFCCDSRIGYSFETNTSLIGYRAFSAPSWSFWANVTFSVI